MGVFRFKHFEVRNERSAMKVNTDGVLLGAAAHVVESTKCVLDVGTGTGTIALMLAQRLALVSGDFHICGIDVDEPSALEALENFTASPWSENLKAYNLALRDFQAGWAGGPYDLIVSNPPYFESSLGNSCARRTGARHTLSLSYRDLVNFAKEFLSETGRLSFILPVGNDREITRYAAAEGLFLVRQVLIKTVPRKEAIRVIYEFAKEKESLQVETLSIKNADGTFSDEYRAITGDFYL